MKYVIATTAVLTLMPKFLFYSWVTTDCYTSICAVIFIAAAADLVDLADGFASSPMASPSSLDKNWIQNERKTERKTERKKKKLSTCRSRAYYVSAG